MATPNACDGALDLMATFRFADGRAWGQIAEPFQWEAARAALYHASKPYAFWTRPRGGSKTADAAAIALAVMLVQAPIGSRLYVCAADQAQGRLVIDSIREYATHTAYLRSALEIRNFTVVVRGTGTMLEVMAADTPGAWGLRPYFVIVDELAQWRESNGSKTLLDAIRTAVPKTGGRMVICTTPGDPLHFARDVRDHAAVDPLWNLFEVEGPLPWLSATRLEEQERSLTPSRFRRLHLGLWAEPEARLASLEHLRSSAMSETSLPRCRGINYVIGLDVGLVHDRTAAAVCHSEEITVNSTSHARRIVVDLVKTWRGTPARPVDLSEVEDWVHRTALEYNEALVVLESWQTAQMQQQLRARGTRTEVSEPSQARNNLLATTLLTAIRQERLVLPNNEETLAELARVNVVEVGPGLLRLDHRAGEHDDQAIAIGLSAVRLLDTKSLEGPRLRVLSAPEPSPRLRGGSLW